MEGREPSAKKFKRYWPAGRLEVEPESYDSNTTVFLHLLSPVDTGQPPAKYTFRQEPDRYILTVAGKQLMFASDGRSCRIRSAVA